MTTDRHAETGPDSTVPDEIERTREQLGETVEALVAKADVKARAKERTAQLSQTLKDKTAQAKEQTTARVGQARGRLAGKTPDAKTVTEPVQRAARHVKQHAATPAGGLVAAAAAGAVVLGFIVIRRRRRR